jgi:rod shape determining protein RodA
MMALGNKFFYNSAYIFYIIGVFLLILVLFLGVDVNNARCWFRIPFL